MSEYSWAISPPFSIVDEPLTLPLLVYENYNFITSSPTRVVCCLFGTNNTFKTIMTHCGFDLLPWTMTLNIFIYTESNFTLYVYIQFFQCHLLKSLSLLQWFFSYYLWKKKSDGFKCEFTSKFSILFYWPIMVYSFKF